MRKIILLAVMVLAILAAFVAVVPGAEPKSADASAGYTTVTILGDVMYTPSSGSPETEYWIDACLADPGGLGSGPHSSFVGWATTANNPPWPYIYAHYVGFPVAAAGIPEDAEIVDIKIDSWIQDLSNVETATQMWFKWVPMADPDFNSSDWNNNRTVLSSDPFAITNAYALTELTQGTWFETDVRSQMYDYIRDTAAPDGNLYLWLDTTNNLQMVKPSTANDIDTKNYITVGTTAKHDKLIITYATAAADREFTDETNDEFTGAISGNETVNSIDWRTPRAAWADEDIHFGVNGDAGYSGNLVFSDYTGAVLDTTEFQIGDSGLWTWNIHDWDSSFEGYVRCLVKGTTIKSLWGHVEPAASPTMQLLQTYAESTVYPQYDTDFNSYVVYKNNVGIIYWKTNLEAADMANYQLQILSGGETALFSQTMSWMNTNYFKTANSDYNYLAHWRYMIFSPYVSMAGFNSYDGMIYNLGKDYYVSNYGFLQPTIRAVSDNSSITWTHTSYWYLNDVSQGIKISLDKASYAMGEPVRFKLTVGHDSKVADRLKYVQVSLIDSSGTIEGTASGSVVVGDNYIDTTAPFVSGAYTLRTRFFDSDLVPDYEYIHDLNFTITTTTTTTGTGAGAGTGGTVCGNFQGNIMDLFSVWLAEVNMDNTVGHLIFIIIVMAVLFIVCYKSSVLRVVLPMLVLGVAIIGGWADPWLIALLALGGALTIWQITRRKVAGGAD